MYEIITEEIHNRNVQEPAMVSWLGYAAKKKINETLSKNPMPDIRSIDNPPETIQYDYVDPDYSFFDDN